jgi:hypothetical protein
VTPLTIADAPLYRLGKDCMGKYTSNSPPPTIDACGHRRLSDYRTRDTLTA